MLIAVIAITSDSNASEVLADRGRVAQTVDVRESNHQKSDL